MQLNEFIKKMQEVEAEVGGDVLVLLSCDEEGNRYGDFGGVGWGHTCEKDGREYEIGYGVITPELEEQGYTDEDLIEGEPCIALYPNM